MSVNLMLKNSVIFTDNFLKNRKYGKLQSAIRLWGTANHNVDPQRVESDAQRLYANVSRSARHRRRCNLCCGKSGNNERHLLKQADILGLDNRRICLRDSNHGSHQQAQHVCRNLVVLPLRRAQRRGVLVDILVF